MRLNRIVLALALVTAFVAGSAFSGVRLFGSKPAFAQAEPTGKLAEILARGSLNCGVSGGVPGFSFQNPDTGEWQGLDVDFCRALAAAIFGEVTETNLVFVPLTADVRFTALQAGEVDILHRNTTWTLTRDLTLTSDFGPTTFYDGQGLLVRVADGFTGLVDLDGTSICSTSGTTTEKNISDAMNALGYGFELVLADTPEQNLRDFEQGRCDVLTSDKSQLSGLRSVAADPGALTLLPDTLSKEPLGPMYLDNDSQFADIVNWSVYATFQAEELGITSTNIDDFADSGDITVQRFLGLTQDNYGTALGGLSNTWAADIIRAVGNYAEIYERNVTPIGITREGSLNDLWKRGGLLYAPAWR